MITRLALRNLVYRPWRSLLLLVGYGLGVGVMIVLLAIGEALLTQARDERLVGGGEVTVLPDGLNIEVMKTGGVGGLFFSIANARFVYRQLLAAPRHAREVAAVSPQITRKLLYLRTPAGEYAVRATGEIPSRTKLVGAAPALVAGAWDDDAGDIGWMTPTPAQLYSEIDHFHVTPASVANRESWAEWHYFNVLWRDGQRWAFISYVLHGDVPHGRWGGQLGVTLREQGGRTRRFVADVRPAAVHFSTTSPDLALGASRVVLRPDGRYAVTARAREVGGKAVVTVDLVISPIAGAYFPGATLARGSFTSGYAVPALRANATGRICVDGVCQQLQGVQAYHDHNWGVWRDVTWEWGAARAGDYTFLYGRVRSPDRSATSTPLFFYLVDSLGFRALFRPRAIRYTDGRVIAVHGRRVRVPSRALITDVRGDDTLRVTLEIEDAIGTDTREALVARGDERGASRLAAPYFIQMKGTARLSGRVDGQIVRGRGRGFFETYR